MTFSITHLPSATKNFKLALQYIWAGINLLLGAKVTIIHEMTPEEFADVLAKSKR
jgi:hypothetical protein